MKIQFTLAAGITALSLGAQSPATLLDSGKIWSCYGDYFFLNVKYRLGEDTLIQGKTYKKVLAHGSDTPFNFDSNEAVYKSAVREENGRIMVVEKGFINEHILYDFNKVSGDTIRFYRPIGDFNQGVLPNYVLGKIYKTDQVTMNGVVRKRWFIHDPAIINLIPQQAYSQLDPQADIWIEGLGAKTGLFSRMPEWGVVGPQPYLLTCVEDDGLLVYQNNTGYNADEIDPCFITPPGGNNSGGNGGGTGNGGNDSLVLNISSRTDGVIQVFPNPAREQINLFPVPGDFVMVRITDFRGQVVVNRRVRVQRQHVQIDLSSITEGMYVMHLTNNELNRSFRISKE
jgi:hypothetical protein